MKIKAVELMRSLRDQIARETSGMSWAEKSEYYQEGARSFQAWLKEAREKDAQSPEIKKDRRQTTEEKMDL